MMEKPYYGPPEPQKEYLSVSDVLRAARHALERPKIKSVTITKLDDSLLSLIETKSPHNQ